MSHCRLRHAGICRPGHRSLYRVLSSDRRIYLQLGGSKQLSSEQHYRVGLRDQLNARANIEYSQWKRAVTAVGAMPNQEMNSFRGTDK